MLVQCTLRMPRMHSERERIAPPCAPSQDALVLIPCVTSNLGRIWPVFHALWPTSPTQDEQCSPPTTAHKVSFLSSVHARHTIRSYTYITPFHLLLSHQRFSDVMRSPKCISTTSFLLSSPLFSSLFII